MKLFGAAILLWGVLGCAGSSVESSSGAPRHPLAGSFVATSSDARIAGAAISPRERGTTPSVDSDESSSVDLMATLERTQAVQSFTEAVKRTGVDVELEREGPFTVLAPVDFAFQRLPLEYRAALFGPAGDDRLRDLVRRHIVIGEYSAEDMADAGQLTTLAGTKVAVRDLGGLAEPGGAQVLSTSRTRSGVVHTVDRLVVP